MYSTMPPAFLRKAILGCAKNVEGLDCEFLCLDVRDIVEIRNIVVDTL